MCGYARRVKLESVAAETQGHASQCDDKQSDDERPAGVPLRKIFQPSCGTASGFIAQPRVGDGFALEIGPWRPLGEARWHGSAGMNSTWSNPRFRLPGRVPGLDRFRFVQLGARIVVVGKRCLVRVCAQTPALDCNTKAGFVDARGLHIDGRPAGYANPCDIRGTRECHWLSGSRSGDEKRREQGRYGPCHAGEITSSRSHALARKRCGA